jgi:hypothetical protein
MKLWKKPNPEEIKQKEKLKREKKFLQKLKGLSDAVARDDIKTMRGFGKAVDSYLVRLWRAKRFVEIKRAAGKLSKEKAKRALDNLNQKIAEHKKFLREGYH